MTDTTHTPGPWVLDGPGTAHITGDEDCYHCINGAEGWLDSKLYLSGFMLDADACLIAAAPDMLAALRDAALQIEYLHDKFQKTGSGNTVLTMINNAITRATGGAA